MLERYSHIRMAAEREAAKSLEMLKVGPRLVSKPQLVPLYRKLFALYRNTAGAPLAVLGCPLKSDGSSRGESSER